MVLSPNFLTVRTKGGAYMKSCDPIMVLSEDIELIDGIVEKRYKGSGNIFDRENRKELIAARKVVLHEIVVEWQNMQGKK